MVVPVRLEHVLDGLAEVTDPRAADEPGRYAGEVLDVERMSRPGWRPVPSFVVMQAACA
jgi:hypothetical protein